MKYRPKHVAEYVLLATFVFVIRLTPHRLAMLQGWILAGFIHHVIGFRKKVVRQRIRQVFGDKLSDAEIRKTAWRSFRNLTFNAIELIRAPRLSDRWIEKYVSCDDTMAAIREHTDQQQGVIVVFVHSGNWDLTGVVSSRKNIPAAYIARTQKNPLTNALLNDMRSLRGSIPIDRDDKRMLPKILANLKEGRALAILIDLRAKTNVPEVDFLGHKANLGAGVVMMAQHGRNAIAPMVLSRKGWLYHEWKPLPPIYTDPEKSKKQERQEILQTLLDQYTDVILDQPEQYFWYNKRWVLDPIKD